MSASMSQGLKAEPNLTPLLDVVFQLITFFMLVINFTNDNYDTSIKLPVAGSARPLDDAARAAAEDRLVLNIDSKGQLIWNGKPMSGGQAVDQIKFEAQLARLNRSTLTGGKKPAGADEGLPTRVVIRADRNTEFDPIYSLITACQANGYRKFDLKAMTGP
jgi:biopolymer transport protein ExbD